MAKLTKPARDRISATKFGFPQATEGAAGKCLPRAHCGRTLQPGEGRTDLDRLAGSRKSVSFPELRSGRSS